MRRLVLAGALALASAACSPAPPPVELVAFDHARRADYAATLRDREPSLIAESDRHFQQAQAAYHDGDDTLALHHTRMARILWRTAEAKSHAKDLRDAATAAARRQGQAQEDARLYTVRAEAAERAIERIERTRAMREKLEEAVRSARQERRANEARVRVEAAAELLQQAEEKDAARHAPGPLNRARQSLANAFDAFNQGRYADASAAANVALADAGAALTAARPAWEAEARQRALDAELRTLLDETARIGHADARIEQRGLVISMRELFVPAADTLTDPGPVQRLAELARAHPGFRLVVEGHSDNRGRADVNLALSDKRARVVTATLEAAGIPADRMTPVGKGDQEPIADNGTREGRARNRRVEVIFVRPVVPVPTRP
ncbi:MAG: OmpA family protein [bacterium]